MPDGTDRPEQKEAISMADDILCGKELYDENGYLKNVSTVEDAKAVMRHCSPERTRRMIGACKESMIILSVCGVGVLGLLLYLMGTEILNNASPVLMIWLFALPIAIPVVVQSWKIHEEREKNDAIISGAYFEGKSDAQIIDEANEDFVRLLNNLKDIKAAIALRKGAEEEAKARKRSGFHFPFGRPGSK